VCCSMLWSKGCFFTQNNLLQPLRFVCLFFFFSKLNFNCTCYKWTRHIPVPGELSNYLTTWGDIFSLVFLFFRTEDWYFIYLQKIVENTSSPVIAQLTQCRVVLIHWCQVTTTLRRFQCAATRWLELVQYFNNPHSPYATAQHTQDSMFESVIFLWTDI